MKTIGVVLAAGGSSRFGSPKQLADWNGQPLIVHAITQLEKAGCDSVVVILGASSDQIRDVIAQADAQVVIVENPDWNQGQSSSIRVACESVGCDLDADDSILMTLCDQPLISVDHYQRLIRERRSKGVLVAATSYMDGAGVPACFGVGALSHLMQLRGDQGAKYWIRSLSPSEVILLENPAALKDIDRPCDLHSVPMADDLGASSIKPARLH
ncbi:nucleotidyltransferase family protein [Lacunimicrobium album]